MRFSAKRKFPSGLIYLPVNHHLENRQGTLDSGVESWQKLYISSENYVFFLIKTLQLKSNRGDKITKP